MTVGIVRIVTFSIMYIVNFLTRDASQEKKANLASHTLVFGGVRRALDVGLEAVKFAREDADVELFKFPMDKETAETYKTFRSKCIAFDAWLAASKDQLSDIGSIVKVDLVALREAWSHSDGLNTFTRQLILQQWRPLFHDAASKLDDCLPPDSVFTSVAMFTKGSEEKHSVAASVKKLSESGAMKTASELLLVEKATEQNMFKSEIQLVSTARTKCRKMICLDWASDQVVSFVAKGPESMVKFSRGVYQKLETKGMGSPKTCTMEVPVTLRKLLDSITQKGEKLLEQMKKDLEYPYLLGPAIGASFFF